MEIVTFSIAVLGAILGVLSTVRDWRRDRVRLRVTPQVAYPSAGTGDTRPRLAIDVANLSAFPVTVSEVGFLLKRTKNRRALSQPLLMDGGPWPRRLQPHESVTAWAAPGEETSGWLTSVRAAYAKTPSGHVATGHSPMLRWVTRTGSLPAPPRRLTGAPGAMHQSSAPEE